MLRHLRNELWSAIRLEASTLTKGGNATASVALQREFELPANMTAASFAQDPTRALDRALGHMSSHNKATVTLAFEGSGNLDGPTSTSRGIKAEISFEKDPNLPLTQVVTHALTGDLSGAARLLGDGVPVRTAAAPFSSSGHSIPVGLSRGGWGAEMKATAMRQDMAKDYSPEQVPAETVAAVFHALMTVGVLTALPGGPLPARFTP